MSNLKGDTAPLSSENNGEAGLVSDGVVDGLDCPGLRLDGRRRATTRLSLSLLSSARASAKSLFTTTNAASNRSVSGFLAIVLSSSSCFRRSASTDASR